jgi:hypothetical protein
VHVRQPAGAHIRKYTHKNKGSDAAPRCCGGRRQPATSSPGCTMVYAHPRARRLRRMSARGPPNDAVQSRGLDLCPAPLTCSAGVCQ